MYFGWADPALNPLMGVNYYEQVRRTLGGRDRRVLQAVHDAGRAALRPSSSSPP
jgi:hypothetical protein